MGSDASISTYWRIHKHRGLIWVAADAFIICQGCHNDLALVWLRRTHDGNKKALNARHVRVLTIQRP